jgi:hypothetical protein
MPSRAKPADLICDGPGDVGEGNEDVVSVAYVAVCLVGTIGGQVRRRRPLMPMREVVALAEVVVTTQRREEDLQKAPVGVAVVSGEDLSASNVMNLQDLTTLVSGFNGPGDNGMSSPDIRGVGSQRLSWRTGLFYCNDASATQQFQRFGPVPFPFPLQAGTTKKQLSGNY